MGIIKYNPSAEELLSLLKHLVMIGFIKPNDLEDILTINLKKYNMIDRFSYFKIELLKALED